MHWGVGTESAGAVLNSGPLCPCRPCCPWAVSVSSPTAASMRRPTAATSWASAPTCRSLPTCWPQVCASGLRVRPHDWVSAVCLRTTPAGLRGRRFPCCRTHFPNDIGLCFLSLRQVWVGLDKLMVRVACWGVALREGMSHPGVVQESCCTDPSALWTSFLFLVSCFICLKSVPAAHQHSGLCSAQLHLWDRQAHCSRKTARKLIGVPLQLGAFGNQPGHHSHLLVCPGSSGDSVRWSDGCSQSCCPSALRLGRESRRQFAEHRL